MNRYVKLGVLLFCALASAACSKQEKGESLRTIEIKFLDAKSGRELPSVTYDRERGYVCRAHGRMKSITVFVLEHMPVKEDYELGHGLVQETLQSKTGAAKSDLVWLSDLTACVLLSDTEAVCSTYRNVEACSLISYNFAQYSTE